MELPSGFCRCIHYDGSIYEGNIHSDLQLNGFCIIYSGRENVIGAGWYKNNLRHGNYMAVNGDSLNVIEQGYYANDKKVSAMKDYQNRDKSFVKFEIGDIFQNPFQTFQDIIS